MEIKAVIFDLDGVLTDTAPLHYQAWKETVKKVNIQNLNPDYLDKVRGVDRENALKMILDENDVQVNETEFQELMEFKNASYLRLLKNLNQDSILPGIKDFLCDLKIHQIPLVLGSASHNATMILKRIGLDQFFDQIVDPQEIKNSKPAPDIFLKAVQLVNVSAHDCVVIEDALVGIQAAQAAGCQTIGINVEADLKLNSTAELKINLFSFPK